MAALLIVMKKIENWLFLPVLVLLFYSASEYSAATTDIHLNDSYYIISNASIARGLLTWLILVFIFFKVMRRRNPNLNNRLVVSYMVLTGSLLSVWYIASGVLGAKTSSGFSDAELNRWVLFNQIRMTAGFVFGLVQVIFLVYFVVLLLKKRVN